MSQKCGHSERHLHILKYAEWRSLLKKAVKFWKKNSRGSRFMKELFALGVFAYMKWWG